MKYWPILRVLAAALLLLLVFVLFAYQYLQADSSFNSDQLYCPHFCDDLLHGRDVRGFHLPAAPYLFPDMALTLAGRALTPSLPAFAFVYGALFYGLALAVLFALFAGMELPRRDAFGLAALGLALLLAVHFDPAYLNRRMVLFYPGNHMGCLIVGLGLTAFLLRVARTGYTPLSAGLFLLTATLTASSDQLLIVQFLAPMGGAVLLLAMCRRFPLRRALLTLVLTGASALLALKAHAALRYLGFVPLIDSPAAAPLSLALADDLRGFARMIWLTVHDQPLIWVAFIFHIASLLTILVISWRRSRRIPASDPARPESVALLLLGLVLLLGLIGNAAALIVTGVGKEPASLRYLYTWWFLPFVCLPLWPRLLAWRTSPLMTGAVIAVILFRVSTFPEPLNADLLAARYPPLAQALDELVRKHGHLRGFADFWHARELHYLTREHVEVLPVLPCGIPWFHAFNPNRFLSSDPSDLSIPAYHFVIVSAGAAPGPTPEHIRARYGNPIEIIPVEGHEIWRYERLENRQMELFLRAQLAQRLVRARPHVSPVEPHTLGKPRRNLTPLDARDNLALRPGEPLTLRFAQPVTGRTIAINASCSDEFVLHFSRKGREQATARVPSLAWTGAENAYGDPGLQSRLIAVPPACGADGFDEVRLVPRGWPRPSVLGHFLVFDEPIPERSNGPRPTENYHRYEGEHMANPGGDEITTIADPSASAGQARRSCSQSPHLLAFGPYLPLPPGHYRVDFVLKIEDNSCTDSVAILDCAACSGRLLLQERTLRGRDFAGSPRYQTFRLTFDAEDELDLVEFRVRTTGKTVVLLDYIDVTRVVAQKTSEACEP